MINNTTKKPVLFMLALSIFSLFLWFAFDFQENKVIELSCKAKGIIHANGYELSYVNSYRFNKNGTGASAVSGIARNNPNVAEQIGVQIYFKYRLDNGLLTMETTDVVMQTENTASDHTIHKLFPSLYYRVGSVHKVAIFKMGSGYRLDYNTYPVNYCY